MHKCKSWLWHLAKEGWRPLAGHIGGLADVSNGKGEAKQMSSSVKREGAPSPPAAHEVPRLSPVLKAHQVPQPACVTGALGPGWEYRSPLSPSTLLPPLRAYEQHCQASSAHRCQQVPKGRGLRGPPRPRPPPSAVPALPAAPPSRPSGPVHSQCHLHPCLARPPKLSPSQKRRAQLEKTIPPQ